MQFGEERGVRALVLQAELAQNRRTGVILTENEDVAAEEAMQQAERRQRLASEVFDPRAGKQRNVRQHLASEVSHPQVGIHRCA